MNIKIQIIISALILSLMTGIAAAETQPIVNPIDADMIVLVGDIDNFGFGWPQGFDVFSGMSTPVHEFPFKPEAQDPPGTDRIMVATSYAAPITPTLKVVANPTTVTAGTSTSVTFTVIRTDTNEAVSDATATLTGEDTGQTQLPLRALQ